MKGQGESINVRPTRRSISPPTLKRKRSNPSEDRALRGPQCISSPIQLTRIKDLSEANNADTVMLSDLIGDAHVSECWQFNFLFDVDFMMTAFHSDVRDKVRVKVIHGSWKQEDPDRQAIEAACERWPNVQAITAYMPEPFGTHHTKMMIVFRDDGAAQVVITTANMIAIDWANMTQAVWQSPRLPLARQQQEGSAASSSPAKTPPFGSGRRFQMDLLNYLKAYGLSKTGTLVEKLSLSDFDSIRAALIGSVPVKQKTYSANPGETLWGWQGLREITRRIPTSPSQKSRPVVISQISSIASLGTTDAWLTNFIGSLEGQRRVNDANTYFRIVFPSPDEIRRSIGGYASGASIHAPNNTIPAQQKQLDYLRSKMCYWAGDGAPLHDPSSARGAGRRRAAPHIKTYLRFADEACQRLDWAMMTSANLSKQAWGELPNKSGEVRIQSWELGVVVWPQLFAEDENTDTIMVPTFKTDTPSGNAIGLKDVVTVGLRMPYDLPLVPYTKGEKPWCNKVPHEAPDWKGETWPGR